LSHRELGAVHTPACLAQLRDAEYLARALEVPPLRRLPAVVLRSAAVRRRRGRCVPRRTAGALASHSQHRFRQRPLLICNGGTDILAGDPLGLMGVSASAVLARDRFGFAQAVERDIPLVVLPSGDDTDRRHTLIAESVCALIAGCADCRRTER
jgi:hypothetical protein